MFKALVFQRTNLLSGAIANLDVIKASINEDLTQKATSSITCLNVPTSVVQNDIIRIYDSKGKFVYWGIINGINDNVIKCSQFQSLFNDKFLLSKAETSAQKQIYSTSTISELIKYVINYRMQGKITDVDAAFIDKDVSNNFKGITISVQDDGLERYPYPLENKVINIEEFIYEMFNTYNRLIIPVWINSDKRVITNDNGEILTTNEGKRLIYERVLGVGEQHMDIMCCNPSGIVELKDGEEIDFNHRILFQTYENLSNISIVKQDEETNTVYIYNKEGTSLRGAYTVNVDGELKQITNDLEIVGRLGTNKTKYIFDSDNDVLELARSELPTVQYNHKISFNISFEESNKFDDYILGGKVKYYDNSTNRLFDTILTARQYEISENSSTIKSAKLTLGKVRQTLTSALNKTK